MFRQGLPRRTALFRSFAVLAVGALLAQCDRETPAEPPAAAPEIVPDIAIQTRPLAPAPALTRAELINALAQAASVHAAGTTAQGSDATVGRTFALRLPFGCSGPDATTDTPADGLARWSWGPDQKTIRLSMTPGDWTTSPLVEGAMVTAGTEPAPDAWETVEGFWIARPWLATETCPTARLSASIGAPPSPQTAGLAAVFEQDGSRLGRRNGRAYTHTVRPEGDAPLTAPAAGYRLLLEGRIVAFPNTGRATRCVSYSPDQRPTCVAAVQLDKVAFEDGATGKILSEWRTR